MGAISGMPVARNYSGPDGYTMVQFEKTPGLHNQAHARGTNLGGPAEEVRPQQLEGRKVCCPRLGLGDT